MKSENSKHSFASRMVNEAGFPEWEKAIVGPLFKESDAVESLGANTGQIADTGYVYIPLVKTGTAEVNAVFVCRLFDDSVEVKYFNEKDYTKAGFHPEAPYNANRLVGLMMIIQNRVYGTTSFVVNDGRLFSNNGDSTQKRIVRLRLGGENDSPIVTADIDRYSFIIPPGSYYCMNVFSPGCGNLGACTYETCYSASTGLWSGTPPESDLLPSPPGEVQQPGIDPGSGGTGGGNYNYGSVSTQTILQQVLGLNSDELSFLNNYSQLSEETYNYINNPDGQLTETERRQMANSHIDYLMESASYLNYCLQANALFFTLNGFTVPWFYEAAVGFENAVLYSNIQQLKLDAKQAFYLLNDSIRSSEIKNYLDNSVTPIEEKKIQGLKHLNTLLKYGGYENFIQNYSVTHGSNLMWWENANFEEYCEYWGVWLDETKPIAPNTKGSEQFEYIDNVEDYLKCFNDGKVASSYELKVYVDDPPGDGVFQPNYITKGIKDQGHTFIEIIKNNNDGTKVSQLIGFYPDPNSLPTLQNPATLGKLKNDSNHEYDSKVEIIITQENFNTVLGKVRSYALAGYDFEQFNCTSFAKEISASIGVTMPSGYRTFGTPEGGRTYAGVCPSGLHIDIFNWPNKPSNVHNVQKYTFAQNAPVGKGKCQ